MQSTRIIRRLIFSLAALSSVILAAGMNLSVANKDLIGKGVDLSQINPLADLASNAGSTKKIFNHQFVEQCVTIIQNTDTDHISTFGTSDRDYGKQVVNFMNMKLYLSLRSPSPST